MGWLAKVWGEWRQIGVGRRCSKLIKDLMLLT